MMQGISQTSQQ